MEIRLLEDADLPAAYFVMRELRAELAFEDFLDGVEAQRGGGYLLVGVFDEDLVAVMGMRPVRTLARGRHLHIDDLVVTVERRGGGLGSALLDYAEAHARGEQMAAIFLDAVAGALSFYQDRRFAVHRATLVWKPLVAEG